jgi:hypothetical protein
VQRLCVAAKPQRRKTRRELAANPLNGMLGAHAADQPSHINGTLERSTGNAVAPSAALGTAGNTANDTDAVTHMEQPLSPALVAEMLMGESGISGTANLFGRLFTEETADLQWTLAFQVPGSNVFGQWEAMERRNPYVTAGLESVKSPIRDARVDVEAADGVPNGELHAKVVEWNLKKFLEPGFARVLERMVSSLLYGFSLQELCFEPVQDELFGGWGLAVAKVGELLPTSIWENGWVTKDRELLAIKQRGYVDGQWRTLDMPATKVLLTTWNRTGDNYAGFSAYRPVWYAAKIMEHALRLNGVSMVREAAGLPIAEVDPKAPKLSKDARKRLQRLLMNMVYHEQAAVVLPPGVKLQWFVSPGRDKSSLISQYHDLGKLILFQTQSQQMGLGVDGTGSRAVGSVHAQTSEQFAQGVVSLIEEVLNGTGRRPYTGLARKIIDANFGPQPAYPLIRLTLKRSKLEPQDRADAIQKYRAGGVLRLWRPIDENVVREDTGLPPVDEDEFNAFEAANPAPALPANGEKDAGSGSTPAAQAQPAKAAPGAVPNGGGGPEVHVVRPAAPAPSAVHVERPAGTAPVSRVDVHRPLRRKLQAGPYVPWRELRSSELRLDVQAIDSTLTKARDNFETWARSYAAAMLARAKPAITAALADGDPSELAKVSFDTAELAIFVAGWMGKLRAFGRDQVQRERAKGNAGVAEQRSEGEAAATSSTKHLASEEEKEDERSDATDEADQQLDQMQKRLVRRITGRLSSELERQAENQLRTDGDEDDVVDAAMSDLLNTGAFRADAGTVITKAFNVGREEFAAEHGDEVESVELSALLDKDCCDECERVDGEEFEFDGPDHDRYTPPLSDICDGGDNCRCLLLYNFKKDAGGSDEPEAEDDDE